MSVGLPFLDTERAWPVPLGGGSAEFHLCAQNTQNAPAGGSRPLLKRDVAKLRLHQTKPA